jgi:two-component SAPR family response regulator
MKVIIVDDEKSTLLIMKKMISKIPGVEIVGAFQRAKDAYSFLRENKVDMMFVDISMPEESGLELGRRMMSEMPGMDLVYVTSYKEYALEAFSVHAFDYIVKPISQVRLESTIKRAMEKHFRIQANRIESNAKLSIYCLGGLDVRSMDGGIVQLSSSKSAEFLSFLLMHRGRFVSKWSVMEEVFRGMTPQNAETYLNTTTYKLRKALEPYGMKGAIISSNESYTIETKDIYIDFIDFENRINSLATINEFNLEDALKAEKLYIGELYGDKGYYWSLHEKERISELYFSFGKKLASYLLDIQRLAQSLQILRKLTRRNELDEEVICLLMKVYAFQRDKSALLKQYDRYVKVLSREMGVAPSKNVIQLYNSLRENLE